MLYTHKKYRLGQFHSFFFGVVTHKGLNSLELHWLQMRFGQRRVIFILSCLLFVYLFMGHQAVQTVNI